MSTTNDVHTGGSPPYLAAQSLTREIQAKLSRSGNAIHGWTSDRDVRYETIAEWKDCDGLMTSETTATAAAPIPPLPPTLVSDDERASSASAPIESSPTATISAAEAETERHIRQNWYGKAHNYWEDETICPPTIDGVLGGFAKLSKRDLRGSRDFVRYLKEAVRPGLKLTREDNGGVATCACECGAGIGRVTKGLLHPLGFSRCDLVETSPRLLNCAPNHIGEPYASDCRYFCQGLQDFMPPPASYDLVWIQWVVGYLTDEDLVAFFVRIRLSLRVGGVAVLKDNTCEDEAFVVDPDDASATRSLPYLLALAEAAGFQIAYQKFQEGFPVDIFPVPMVALVPKEE